LAELYTRGKGIAPDLREAGNWYQRAAELGDVESQFIIGRLYATGAGVPTNMREAAKWFLRAAEQGHATAAHNIAACYGNGTGVERNAAQAIEWYKKAAANGITASQVQLGKLLSSGEKDAPRDQNLAANLLEGAAATGDREAKMALALLYLQGEGVVRDLPRAEVLLTQAADGGHAGAALQLGHVYFGKFGGDVQKLDKSKAIGWYTKAAEAGNPEAQHILGMAYLNGIDVPVDLAAASSWIEKAAHNDYAPSQFQLGVMFCTGQGVPKDISNAIAWYELAAQLGYPLAQYNLAVMLAKGQGCEPDLNKAHSWFQKAAERGLVAAQNALREFEKDVPR
ncbi:MAG TPA: SEL1-like repeat protein, partial [Candidatus Binatia bacterium]|nr:SEL1-like repeat protein [Candidatus Binatia bacterium]